MIGVTVRVNVKASALPGIILFGKPFSCIAREVVESRFVVIVRKAVRLKSRCLNFRSWEHVFGMIES